MSIVALTSDTLVASPGAGQIEYNGQFYGTDSNASRAQMQRMVLATSQASTSGTSIDFTGLPAWVKRVTVMFNAVSTNGSSQAQIQLGAGSVTTSGYNAFVGTTFNTNNTTRGTVSTTGFPLFFAGLSASTSNYSGAVAFTLLGSNTWTCQGATANPDSSAGSFTTGAIALGGTLDRIRITTVNGTDTFDAGSINILYEG
jgi:hypothetical protein